MLFSVAIFDSLLRFFNILPVNETKTLLSNQIRKQKLLTLLCSTAEVKLNAELWFVKIIEKRIAEKNGKLKQHFKKWNSV